VRASPNLRPPEPAANGGWSPWLWLAILLAFSLALRFLLFPLPGYKIDQANFRAWFLVAAEKGPAGFYAPPNWSDYPPFNVHIFWAFGHLARLLGPESLPWILKLPQNLFDMGIALLLFLFLRRRFGPWLGLLGAALYAFNPATIYDLAVWGQMDSVHTLFMVASLMALLARRWELSAGCLALALLTKPQSVAILPVVAYGVLREGGWRRALTSAGLGALVILLVLLPFQERNPLAFLLERTLGGYGVYAYNSINAYNLWAVMGFWKPDTAPLLGLSLQVWGFLAFSLLVLYVLWQLHRRYEEGSVLFAASLLAFGLFMLLTRMHERYIFPTLALLAMALFMPRARWLYLGLTATLLANLVYILPLLNADAFVPEGHWSFRVLVPANLALFAYALVGFHRQQPPLPLEEAMRRTRAFLEGRGLPRWRGEVLALALLTLAFFLVALWRLGSLRVPTSNWTPGRGEQALYLDLGSPHPVDRLYFLIQGPQEVKLQVFCGRPGEWEPRGNFSASGHWRSWRMLVLNCRSRYVRLAFRDTEAALGEVALFHRGRRLPILGVVGEGASPGFMALVDEQGLLSHPPDYRLGTYFDEIYFVRTAEEHLHLQEPFEWSHPPLGKLIIALGILYLGANPFAWRLPGVILATLMIPLVYHLARRMFGTARAGLMAATLLAFDFMHFTEARLGTAEISILFFVILTFFFFQRYYQPGGEGPRERARNLFLSLLFFGLGFATKWVTATALAGLLILLGGLKLRERRITWWEAGAFLGGLAAAGAVYLLSYIPYLLAGHDLVDLLQLQRSMFLYHAQLKASHPFASPWWSWPFLLKPLWMANSQLDGRAAMIFTMGNPALWLLGPLLILLTALLFLRRRDRLPAFIFVPFLTQWFSFIPIRRVLFIYHFFPNVLFMVLAATLWLEILWGRRRWVALGYLALNGLLFLGFYPVLSGYPISPEYWSDLKRLLPPPLG